jgi:hypothetical protein
MRRAFLSFVVLGSCATIVATRASAVAEHRAAAPRAATPPREEVTHTATGTVARVLAAVETHAPALDPLAELRRRVRRQQAGTYIGEILRERDSALARWPERRDAPITVWVQSSSRVPQFSSAYVASVQDAFTEWDAVNLPVRFTFVGDSSTADVHVTFIDHFDEPISGRTRWTRDESWAITDANILLAVHHYQGELLDADAMRAMALHEIGHLLGLDHTSDSLSVMAPRVRVRELADDDRATARLLYSLPAGPLR